MTLPYTRAQRADIKLLILLASGTGGGKTESAMRLATGLGGGEPFVVIDTENGRALHKADDYDFEHRPLEAPYTPERYAEVVTKAAADGFPVVVIDSGSHEWDGEGGCQDIQLEEWAKLNNRPDLFLASWGVPKRRHKRFVQALLRTPAHVILNLRAEDKIEFIDDPDKPGKKKVVPKRTMAGGSAHGWIPICERRLPFEATVSFLLMADKPGVPIPIKLERRHKDFVPLDQPLSEDTGRLLADWARGKSSGAEPSAPRAAGAATTAPSASDDPGASPPLPAADADAASQDSFADDIHALNALVGSMREAGAIATRDLYIAVAEMRGLKGDEKSQQKPSDILIALLKGQDDAGELHWTPLRSSLTPEEAKELRSRLGRKWAAAQEAVPA